MGICTGVCDNGTFCQGRADAGMHNTFLIRECGRTADKALSTFGHISTENEVKLSAGTTDVFGSGRLGTDLSEQVDIYTVVDGDEVVQCCDGADIVGVTDRCAHQFWIFIQIIIHLLGSGTETIYLTVAVNVFAGTGNLSGFGNVYECIYIHFCVNTKIL